MKIKPIVFIGSTVVDIMLRLPHLPNHCEDINIESQGMSLGGCAFNAAWMSHLLHVDYILFSPIGTGIYAEYIKSEMKKNDLAPLFLHSNEENGCCYCLIEENGERSFLSYHGAEYKFQKEWFERLDELDIDTVYICGLEIEEDSGKYILDYLERHPHLTTYFACGPRLDKIPKEKMKKFFSTNPILHLNEEEILSYTTCTTLLEAALFLYQQTQNTIIVTMGDKGCCYYDQDGLHHIPTNPIQQIDTTGAGDCHIGSIISYRALGYSYEDAIQYANQNAGKVVSQQGAILSKESLKYER